MILRRLALLVAMAVCGTVSVFGIQSQDWPPASLRPLDPEAPVLSPEDEMRTFVLEPGYHAELVAAEPLVQDPIVIDWDPDGRLWVLEMTAYMSDIRGSNELDPTGRVVVLDDTDGDGRMDTRTVFADGLVLPRALKVLDAGVLVAEPPTLWLMKDTDGDGHADTKEVVTDQYGRRDANVEHNANGLLWALDNWMYTSEADIYLRLRHGTFEVEPTLLRGQWGGSQDDAGRVYRNTNSAALFVDLLPARYFQRQPDPVRTRGFYQSLGGAELNRTWPIMPTPGVNRGYQFGVLREDKTLASFTAVSAPTVYRGDRLPRDLYGNVFLAEPSANLVSRVIVEDDGTTLRGRKAYEGAEFMASSNERFRPVYLSSAPDGTLYVVDMYHGIIQHRGYITEYLRDQILSRNLQESLHHGRIWRVVHETTTRGPRPALEHATTAELVRTLSHPNGWWRDTAQQLLVERADRSAVPALSTIAGDEAAGQARLHALWALDGIGALEPATVIDALSSTSRDVRVSALRSSEPWLASNADVRAAVLARMDDADWWVREQLAATLGFLPADEREPALATLLERHAGDPVVVDAAMSSLRGSESAVLARLLTRPQTPNVEVAIAMIAATALRADADAAWPALVSRVTDAAQPLWQRSALMRGIEVAWLGSPAPVVQTASAPQRRTGRGGGAGPNRVEPPCPTCPGGRAGPGGAPAFPTASAGGGGGQQRTAPPPIAVAAEPAALVALARERSELGTRAGALLERLTWPGRAGAAAPATPLTPEEERRFAAGQEVYRNLCIACHQENGRGQEKVAPPLVGSALALADPDVPVRIVLNGKEGSIGLMPPLGTTLTDDQIAAVLTYVRRAWGQTGSPVTPALVTETRAATASRTRPWTNAELEALGGRQTP